MLNPETRVSKMSLLQEFTDLYASVALWLERLVAAEDTVALKAPFQKFFFPLWLRTESHTVFKKHENLAASEFLLNL